jgi:hypothetical protein
MAKRINLIGHKYGKLTVIKEVEQIGKERRFKCLCDCGNTTTVLMASLRSGNTKSCGCLISTAKFDDLTGQKFGRLTVLKKSEKKANNGTYWDVICDCGNTNTPPVLAHNLRSGMTKSCGCYKKVANRTIARTRKKLKTVNAKRINLKGQQFGDLTVLSLSLKRGQNNTRLWLCKCSCGEKIHLHGYSLIHGHYKSCGCKRDTKRDAGAREHIKQDRVAGTRKSALKAKLHKDNKSGHKGVIWMDKRQKWKAYIGFQGKQITLGYFNNLDDAITARKAAEVKYYKPILEENKGERN